MRHDTSFKPSSDGSDYSIGEMNVSIDGEKYFLFYVWASPKKPGKDGFPLNLEFECDIGGTGDLQEVFRRKLEPAEFIEASQTPNPMTTLIRNSRGLKKAMIECARESRDILAALLSEDDSDKLKKRVGKKTAAGFLAGRRGKTL